MPDDDRKGDTGMEVRWVTNPATAPPDPQRPYVAVEKPGGAQEWLEVATDGSDGVADGDLDFAAGRQWASEQKE